MSDTRDQIVARGLVLVETEMVKRIHRLEDEMAETERKISVLRIELVDSQRKVKELQKTLSNLYNQLDDVKAMR